MDDTIDNSAMDSGTESEEVSQAPQSFDETPQAESQQAAGQAEGLIAGKFKSQDDLVKSYKELESKLGNYKDVEAKAQEFDALAEYLNAIGTPPSQVMGQQSQAAPQEIATVDDLNRLVDERVAQKEQQILSRVQQQLRVSSEIDDAERMYPELKTDSTIRELVAGQLVINPKQSVKQAASKIMDRIKVVKEQGATEKIEKVSEKQQAFIEGTRKAPAPTSIEKLRESAMNSGRDEDMVAYLKEAILKG